MWWKILSVIMFTNLSWGFYYMLRCLDEGGGDLGSQNNVWSDSRFGVCRLVLNKNSLNIILSVNEIILLNIRVMGILEFL